MVFRILILLLTVVAPALSNASIDTNMCRGGCTRGPQGLRGPAGPTSMLSQWAFITQIIYHSPVGGAFPDARQGPFAIGTAVIFDDDNDTPRPISDEFIFPLTVGLIVGSSNVLQINSSGGTYSASYILLLQNFLTGAPPLPLPPPVTTTWHLLLDGVEMPGSAYTVTVGPYNNTTGENRIIELTGRAIFSLTPGLHTLQLVLKSMDPISPTIFTANINSVFFPVFSFRFPSASLIVLKLTE